MSRKSDVAHANKSFSTHAKTLLSWVFEIDIEILTRSSTLNNIMLPLGEARAA
jgi:hypothetical protein